MVLQLTEEQWAQLKDMGVLDEGADYDGMLVLVAPEVSRAAEAEGLDLIEFHTVTEYGHRLDPDLRVDLVATPDHFFYDRAQQFHRKHNPTPNP